MSAAVLRLGATTILHDPALAPDIAPHHFDPAWWREKNAEVGSARGRGQVCFVRATTGLWVLRHYLRGGWIARWTADQYCWRGLENTRPWREWKLLHSLHAAGLPVPEPIAARVVRHCCCYRGDLITRLIENTTTLADFLARTPLGADEWRVIGATLRRFHDAGVRHDDINVRNILRGADGRLHLIDFDKAAIVPPGVWQERNVRRFRRSLEKHRTRIDGFHFTAADWQNVLDGYAAGGR